ncbi:MAG TPA: hypothetical protein VJ722_07575, partial [Rhodanobacteraceae bacterium]|nr:hypothetical protein [Rhodanobacteraceae bacterium]
MQRMLALVGCLLGLSCAAVAVRAAPTPLRIAQWQPPANTAVVQEAELVHGRFDAQFRPTPQPLLRAPDARPAWYRLQLAGDWRGESRPLLAIGGDTRARVTVYLPPAYEPRQLSPYDAGLDPRFSRHALVLVLPRHLRADQPIYLNLGAPGQSQPLRAAVVEYAGYQINDLRHVRLSTLFA